MKLKTYIGQMSSEEQVLSDKYFISDVYENEDGEVCAMLDLVSSCWYLFDGELQDKIEMYINDVYGIDSDGCSFMPPDQFVTAVVDIVFNCLECDITQEIIDSVNYITKYHVASAKSLYGLELLKKSGEGGEDIEEGK